MYKPIRFNKLLKIFQGILYIIYLYVRRTSFNVRISFRICKFPYMQIVLTILLHVPLLINERNKERKKDGEREIYFTSYDIPLPT